MGVDVDGDGRVDRWDRDEVLARAQQEEEDREAAESEKAREQKQQGEGDRVEPKEGAATMPPASQ
jgi:hypothetical protein